MGVWFTSPFSFRALSGVNPCMPYVCMLCQSLWVLTSFDHLDLCYSFLDVLHPLWFLRIEWLIESKLHTSLEVPCFLKFCQFFAWFHYFLSIYFLPTLFTHALWLLGLCFYGLSKYETACFSETLFLVPFLGLFSFSVFVLSYSDLFVFALFDSILILSLRILFIF